MGRTAVVGNSRKKGRPSARRYRPWKTGLARLPGADFGPSPGRFDSD